MTAGTRPSSRRRRLDSPEFRRRRLAGCLAAVAIVAAFALAGCNGGVEPRPATTPAPLRTSAAESTSPSGGASECSWPSTANRNASTAVVLADATSYYLFDAATGTVLSQCPLGINLAVATTEPTGSSANGAGTATWYGLLIPGGPRHTIVATPDGAVDLADGHRYAVDVTGFAPVAAGQTSLLMVDSGATTTPTEPSAWCVIERTAPGACNAVPGSNAPGTPVLSREGVISWAPLTTQPTSVEADGQPLSVRTDGRTVIAATGNHLAVSPLGNGWVDLGTQNEPDERPTWYVTSSSVANPTATTGDATWDAVKRAAGSALRVDPGKLTVSDAAIASGTTSIVLLVSAADPNAAETPIALVRVGTTGPASALGVLTVKNATSDGAPAHLVDIGDAVPAS